MSTEVPRCPPSPLLEQNMSQQSDSADFLGGFKPVELRAICTPLLQAFNRLFSRTFPAQANSEYLRRVQKLAENKKWAHLLHAFRMAVGKVGQLEGGVGEKGDGEPTPKKSRQLEPKVKEGGVQESF